jgi:hypothetical protein
MAYSREQYNRIKLGLEPKTTGPKPKKAIPKVSAKKRAEDAEAKEAYLKSRENTSVPRGTLDKISLNQWFDYHMEHSEPVCSECGMRADWVKQPGYEKIWKACQAHVLPKKKSYGFPSIAANIDNHIVLFPSWGGHLCGHHGEYDSSWFNATTMKIWPQVVERFRQLYPLISEKERKNIPEQLLKEIK